MTMHARARRRAVHEARQRAIWEAEARLLERALCPYGVLHRDALRRIAGARRWREGSFHRALETAVAMGLIEPLALGFYRRCDAPERRRASR